MKPNGDMIILRGWSTDAVYMIFNQFDNIMDLQSSLSFVSDRISRKSPALYQCEKSQTFDL